MVFLAELVLRVFALGLARYFSEGWNVFDFVIVIGCLLIDLLDSTLPLQAMRPIRSMRVLTLSPIPTRGCV